jgi:phospholipase C
MLAAFTPATTPLLQAQTPPTPTTPIQHVVVIFQENVSFDHYFGTYPVAQNKTPGEPTFTAAANTGPVNGLNGPLLTANPNSFAPFRIGRSNAVTCDQNHNYLNEQEAANSGLMNKFPEFTGSSSASCDFNSLGKNVVMGYYDGNTVTSFWNYAQNFAMSDNFYNTQFGPSTPGAINLVSGNTTGFTLAAGSANGNLLGGTLIGDARPAGDDCNPANVTTATASGKNVGDLLNAAGLTWGWFQGGFRATSVSSSGLATCASTHNNISGASAGTDYIPHHQPFQFYKSTQNLHHMPPSSVAKTGQTDQANHQYDSADFSAALAAGILPAVTFLKAPAYQDGHAGYSDPLDEQTFVVTTVNAIMKSPFWGSTAIFITYDDSDGWYDHQMSPIFNQSNGAYDGLTGPGNCGDGSKNQFQGRCGYGPRLPMMVISPYAKVNYVDHTVTDQSSVLRFIEDNWNLGRIGSPSLDAQAGLLNNMFDFTSAGAPAVILDPTQGTVVSVGNPPSTGGGGGTGSSPGATTTAVAGPKNLTTLSPAVQLDGTQSTSADGKPLTYAWTESVASPTATIVGASTASPQAQLVGGPGVYTFTLTVTDSTGKTATDTVTIFVP